MSWKELRARSREEAGKRWDAVLCGLGVFTGDRLRPDAALLPGRFFFSADELPAILGGIRERCPEQAARILRQADRICEHKFDLLGYEGLDYGPEIDWHLDAVHGKRAPQKLWYRIRYLDFDEVGDAKVTWELNRHQHLLVLAKAFRLSGKARYAEELFRQWYHWQEANPYPMGVNWASSLELGFRSLSWLWCDHLLKGTGVVPERFSRDVLKSLGLHGRHIEKYLSTYFSPNTHLLGEAVALFFLGTLCPQLASASRWQQLAWKIIVQESERQVQADGMHFELSTYYHVYALDFFLHSRVLASRNSLPIPERFDRTILRMLDGLASLGQAGPPPLLGDDDGGRLFDPRRNRADHLLDPLAVGAFLYQRPELLERCGGVTEESLWLCGPAATKVSIPASPSRPACLSRALASSGIYVLCDDAPVRQQLVFDAGPMGAHSAGHSHADALGLTLSLEGLEWLTDAGTGAYMAPDGTRDRFRTTGAHNTLEIDEQSQARPARAFGWVEKTEVLVEKYLRGQTFDLLRAQHSGYRHLPSPVTHRRTVFHPQAGSWFVLDRAEGPGEHQMKISWHFAPGCELADLRGFAARLRAAGQTLLCCGSQAPDWGCEVGSSAFSKVYGRQDSRIAIRFSHRGRLPEEFLTVLQPASGASAEPVEVRRLALANRAGSVGGFEHSTGPQKEFVFSAGGGSAWELGDWASDAEFLYCAMDAESKICRLIACDAGVLRFLGQTVFGARQRVKCFEWWRKGAAELAYCSEPGAVQQNPGAGPILPLKEESSAGR